MKQDKTAEAVNHFIIKEQLYLAMTKEFGEGFTIDQFKEVLKDKKRLDWLADVDNQIGSLLLPKECVENNLVMRDAIDCAMEME